MNKILSFFEIPASDFNRAVDFYENVFELSLTKMECSDEKMAFFPNGEGAISFSEQIKPSSSQNALISGVLISLVTTDINKTMKLVEQNGGKEIIAKTAIDCEGLGFFAVFTDSEGNNIGLHQH